METRIGDEHGEEIKAEEAPKRKAWTMRGTGMLSTSRRREGSERGSSSSRLRPITMATAAVTKVAADPSPSEPLCEPYKTPNNEAATPNAARAHARPAENDTAGKRRLPTELPSALSSSKLPM
eukprot:6181652-Pleurochrysis_carterae.AAC.2